MSSFLNMLRFLLRIPAPRITKEEALRIAREEVIRQGDTWGIPAVQQKLRTWIVWSNRDVVGSPFVEVDNQTGQVRQFASPPR